LVQPAGDVEGPKRVFVPQIDTQISEGEVLLWVHDTEIVSGKTYQYRAKLVLVNPLLTYDGDVENAADVKAPTIETPPSEWSAENFVPKATEFYVVGANRMGEGSARMTVFTRVLGQRVQKTFTVKRGQPIGGKAKLFVTNPFNQEVKQQEVDFSTGTVLVDLNLNRKIPSGSITKNTFEAIYMDSKGQLRKRIEALDTGSERYRNLRKEADAARAGAVR